jgi:hypothetical protein
LTWKHVYDAGDIPNPARDETHKKSNTIVQTHLDAFERDWDPAFDTAAPGYPVGYGPTGDSQPEESYKGTKGKGCTGEKSSTKGCFQAPFYALKEGS